jgi:dTDP-4-amino-4,6-dideoxygalactose transaminase
MEPEYRRGILARGRPGRAWQAEPLLGSYYGDEEIKAVEKVIRDSMDPNVGFGFVCDEIEEFEAAFAAYCGTKECVTVNGAGTGLDMAMMALDLQPGDEVIVPAINFRAAHLAVIGQGAQIVLGEVDPATLNLDPNHVEACMSPRTRAIFPVHMNGLAAPMDDYEEIARRHPHRTYGPPKIIGDAARACGARYGETRVGKSGWMNVFSFHTQKLMTTLGEGGAITTDDSELADRLRCLRMFGAAERGGPVRSWGSNYKLTKVQAAVGLVQLRRLDQMLAERRKVAHGRSELLQGIPELQLPTEPPGYEHVYYLYTVLVQSAWAGDKRERLRRILRDEFETETIVGNPAVHRQFPFIAEHTKGQSVAVSEGLSERLFCLPIHPLMTDEENEHICAAVWEASERVTLGKD